MHATLCRTKHLHTRVALSSDKRIREVAGVVGGRVAQEYRAPHSSPRAAFRTPRSKPARPPPRVRTAFFYSDHRPRPTRRAVRTSSYITRGALHGHTHQTDNRVRSALSSLPTPFYLLFFDARVAFFENRAPLIGVL